MANPAMKRELCNLNDAFFFNWFSKFFSNQTNKLELILSALNIDDISKSLSLEMQTLIALLENHKIYLHNFSQFHNFTILIFFLIFKPLLSRFKSMLGAWRLDYVYLLIDIFSSLPKP